MLSLPHFGRNFLRNRSFYSEKKPRKTTIPSSSSNSNAIAILILEHFCTQFRTASQQLRRQIFLPACIAWSAPNLVPRSRFGRTECTPLYKRRERPTSFPVPSARQGPRQMALVQAELLCTAIGQCNRISKYGFDQRG